MKDLTIAQLESQKEAINAARFLMENNFFASEKTIDELLKAVWEIDAELAERLN